MGCHNVRAVATAGEQELSGLKTTARLLAGLGRELLRRSIMVQAQERGREIASYLVKAAAFLDRAAGLLALIEAEGKERKTS